MLHKADIKVFKRHPQNAALKLKGEEAASKSFTNRITFSETLSMKHMAWCMFIAGKEIKRRKQ